MTRNKSHCTDINECRTANGGCSQDCLNTRGSYRCTCSDRYYLSELDGRTCLERPSPCPPLPPPDHGEAECTQSDTDQHYHYQEDEAADEPDRSADADLGAITGWSASRVYPDNGYNASKLLLARMKQSQPIQYNAGSTCVVRCRKGFKLVGDSSFSCDRTGHWLGEPATCIRNFISFYPLYGAMSNKDFFCFIRPQ